MPKKGHTEEQKEQIVAVLRQAEAGEKVSELCRKLGISEATYYAWRKHYAGLGVSELRELRQLRDEWSFEPAGGRSEPGSTDPAGDREKKHVKPGLRRTLGRRARLMRVGWSTWLYRRKVLATPMAVGAMCVGACFITVLVTMVVDTSSAARENPNDGIPQTNLFVCA